jgi:hypothetical protein
MGVRTRWAPGLALALALVACGGGGDEPASSAQCSPAPLTPSGTVTLADRPGLRTDFDESDYAGGSLTFTAQALQPDENVLVIAINSSATDAGTFSVEASGVDARPLARAAPPAAARAGRAVWFDRFIAGKERLREMERRAGAGRAAPTGRRLPARAQASGTRQFRVVADLDTGRQVRVEAALRKETARAQIWVDASNDELSDAQLDQLAGTWESAIYPTVTGAFGAESDSDGNGKVIILFSPVVGASGALGYFTLVDQFPDDEALERFGIHSNEGDMFYVTTPSAAGLSACELAGEVGPATLAHEFEHMISFNQHVLVRGGGDEDTWVDEGLAMMAQDLAGYGPAIADVAARIAAYLEVPEEDSLTIWEGDAALDYGGAYLFFRYLTDRLGRGVLGSLVRTGRTGIANVEAVTGASFRQLERDWRIALAVDNTGILPAEFQYASLNLHDYAEDDGAGLAIGEFLLSGGGEAELRRNGVIYLLSGRGTGGDAVFTVARTGARGVTPRLVVLRY